MRKKTTAVISPYIPFDRISSEVPFYQQIYDGYRNAILTGQLRPGQQLPSTRALASELSISRLPAVNAYEQLLHEGYIEGKIGSGTFVSHSIPDELSKPVSANRTEPDHTKQNLPVFNLPDSERILAPFRVSLPALDQFPVKIWARLISRYAKRMNTDSMAYSDPAGYMPLREAIAEYLRTARAVQCDPRQILIVSGSQMALHICAKALLESGDSICMEEPGYPGARDAFRNSDAQLLPIDLDQEGIDVQKLSSHGKKARVVYVTPSHQYPLGLTMTASRRLDLLDWAQRNKSWIIEDDYDSEFRYSSRPIGSLQGMDPSSRVIYTGTFSKVLFPALRIGYIVVPADLFARFIQIRESIDIFSPVLYQEALSDFIREGHFGRHLRRMRPIYLAKRDSLLRNMKQFSHGQFNPYNIDAGLHLTAFLPANVNDHQVVSRAAARGISATPLSSCYSGKRKKSGLILGFGSGTERQIKNAAQTLSGIIW